MNSASQSLTALILAADREPENPVAKAAGAPCKALAKVAGKPMLQKVLEAVSGSQFIRGCFLCGPPKSMLEDPAVSSLRKKHCIGWIEPQPSPSLSVLAGFQAIPANQKVLLTTADSAMLSPAILDEYCSQALINHSDIAVALVPYDKVKALTPEVQRTALKFKDGPFCSCNLFAFLTPKGREIVTFWRQLEKERKHPWRLIRSLGLTAVLLYFCGQLSSADVAERVYHKLGLRVQFIILSYPEAAIDVDTVEDWKLVQQLVKP